jgi:hypothetical protein
MYYDLFGDLEKRLNRELRGKSASETAERAIVADARPPPAGQVANNDDNNRDANMQDNAQGGGNGDAGADEPGLWTALWQAGNALLGLFDAEEEVVIQAEVRVGGHDHDHDHAHDEEVEMELEQLELEIEAEEREAIAEAAEDAQVAPPADNEEVVVINAVQDAGDGPLPFDANPPVAPAGDAADAADAPDVPGPEAARRRQRDDGAPGMTLSDIINNAATSLLLPTISFGMGELLRVVLPKVWVNSPKTSYGSGLRRGSLLAPTGLLQQRWGRSLVGGCLFIVLKDMFLLYAKYRKVEVKKRRRVRNVKRKRPAADAAATLPANAIAAT